MPSAVVDKLAELATDEPLPESYAGDRIRLFAQSPGRLYVYWGLAKDPYAALTRAFGARSEHYSLVLRLVNTESGDSLLHLASPTKSQWLDVQPGSSYRADLGLYAKGRGFIRLLSSNIAETPRSGVAPSVDPTPEWKISAEKFARVLDEAGYASDALEVTLEAVDEMTNAAATRNIAGALNPAEIDAMTDEDLLEMRRLLVALAFGANIDSMRSFLSPSLATWLSSFNAQEELANSERLSEILRNVLGIEMSRLPIDSPTVQAMRRTVRVVFGASEINLPAPPFHVWMPSMNAGRLKSLASFAN